MDREEVGLLEAIAKNKDALPFDLLFGEFHIRNYSAIPN